MVVLNQLKTNNSQVVRRLRQKEKKMSKINEMIRANRRLTIREISNALNIPFGSLHHILIKDLKMRQVSANFVQSLLSQEQKNSACRHCLSCMIVRIQIRVFSRSLITRDTDTILKRKCRVLTEIARQSKSNVKVMLIAFFNIEGIVRPEFMPRGTTANSEYYEGLLQYLRNDVRRKRPEDWKNGSVLHHENAPW
jgi:hypothetical protein